MKKGATAERLAAYSDAVFAVIVAGGASSPYSYGERPVGEAGVVLIRSVGGMGSHRAVLSHNAKFRLRSSSGDAEREVHRGPHGDSSGLP